MTKAFVTQVIERNEEEQEEVAAGRKEFEVDGRVCHADRPSEAQLALLMTAASRHTTTHEQVAGAINFILNVLDEDDAQVLYGRMLDKADDFGLDEVEEIVSWLVEEWTGHPMKRPSGSSKPRPRTGPASKRTTARRTS